MIAYIIVLGYLSRGDKCPPPPPPPPPPNESLDSDLVVQFLLLLTELPERELVVKRSFSVPTITMLALGV